MKIKLAAIAALCLSCLAASASDYPRLYVSDSDRDAVLHKIENHDWAAESYRRLKEKIDPYVERHKTDPQWIVSRLAMYWKEGEHYTQCYLKKQNWDRGEGNAPVPTVRMPGMRTWNRYSNVPLEERTPYNETGDMWGVNRSDPSSPRVLVPYKESGHMIRGNNVEILTLAEESAFLYWLTENEEYAAFASDVFNAWLVGTWYMNPILDPECSTGGPGGFEPGGICGYYDYEQIHDDLAMHAAVIYDFAYDYLVDHPHPHLKNIGKGVEEIAVEVFKRFINLGMVRGAKSGNWNVNGWNMILRPILLLDDDQAYADGKGRSWYLRHLVKESTPYHDAIPDILTEYDPQTGLWPESPGYSFSVVNMLMEFSTLLTRCENDIISDNPILQKAAMAVFPWMDERGNLIVFGDSRGGPANFNSFEHLLAYYQRKGDKDNAARVISALNAGIENGSYRRDKAGWIGLCTYVADLSKSDPVRDEERISYSPHHRLVTMKSTPDEENLMAVLYGGKKGYHLSPNGLALQLYGYGYALAPDAAGYESYWSADHAYHQSALGSNTIIPGYVEGDVVVTLMDAENPDVTACQMAAGEKRRTVVMVKTGSDSGYYLDVFRSDRPDNDYLFHNVGRSVRFEDVEGNPLETTAADDFEKSWSKGYSWFSNVESVEYDKPFKAVWNVTEGGDPISMHMWMTGASGRTLYRMSAPYTTLLKGITPDNVSSAPHHTPTIIVRQEANNAWDRPYVAVFEPCRSEGPSVVSVEEVSSSREEVLLRVTLKSGRVDHITCREGKVEVTTRHPEAASDTSPSS